MSPRHAQRMGCMELALTVFVLFIGLQFAMLGVRVFSEVAVLTATLVKWLGLALAGAAGLAVVGALAYGAGRAVKAAVEALWGAAQPAGAKVETAAPYPKQAREWQRGIEMAVRGLQRRGWLKKEAARRYRESVRAAVERVVQLEADRRMLSALPASEGFPAKLERAAQALIARLERTHRALTRLLAESALQQAPIEDENLRDAADELESLVAALQDVGAASARVEALAGDDERRLREEVTHLTKG